MTIFRLGPADGSRLSLSRAPYFLRIVEDAHGKIDALDQLDDEPFDGDKISVYVLHCNRGGAFVDGRDKTGKRFGRFEVMADYVLYCNQPQDSEIRDNAKWQSWCHAQPGAHYAGERSAAG